MKTFNDLQLVSDGGKGSFCLDAVREFKMTADYAIARNAEKYNAKRNPTIEAYQKKLTTISGRDVPDIFSSDYKIKSLIFPRLVTQQTMYILGNGLKLLDMKNKVKLGKRFDYQLQKVAMRALVNGQAFGFWNFDHMEVFGYADTDQEPGFCPLYDAKTSALRAGIRFWSRTIGDELIHYFTLYEEDGYTDYWSKDKSQIVNTLDEKKSYIQTKVSTVAGGVEEVIGENYGTLPIVPLYANLQHQSELIGIRESIDCYDLVKSGFANDIDDTSGFYWVLKNTGGMDDGDLAQFVQRMKTVRAASVDADDGGGVEAHTIDIPVEARETLLDRLERDIYKDYQALDVSSLSAAQKTAQEIQAAYQPMDNKCAMFEYQLLEFMDGILSLAGLPDEEASFMWNKISNNSELINQLMLSANYLSPECIISHLPFLTPEEAADEIQTYNQSAVQPFKDDDVIE